MVNVGAGNATVLVELYNGAGTKLTGYTVTSAPVYVPDYTHANEPLPDDDVGNSNVES